MTGISAEGNSPTSSTFITESSTGLYMYKNMTVHVGNARIETINDRISIKQWPNDDNVCNFIDTAYITHLTLSFPYNHHKIWKNSNKIKLEGYKIS